MAEIHTLLAKASNEIRPLANDGVNTHQKFRFRSYGMFFNHLQPLLAKYQIGIRCEVVNFERIAESKGATAIATCRYTFTAPDGSEVSTEAVGEGKDFGDKATSKAMTMAIKYALMQKFVVPFEDVKDPDSETVEDSKQTKSDPIYTGTLPQKQDLAKEANKLGVKDLTALMTNLVPKFKGKTMSQCKAILHAEVA